MVRFSAAHVMILEGIMFEIYHSHMNRIITIVGLLVYGHKDESLFDVLRILGGWFM